MDKKIKDILVVCNTPYQIMFAIQLLLKEFKNDCVDIVISNQMTGGEKIAENIKKCGCFNQVFYIKSRDFKFTRFDNFKALLRPFAQLDKKLRLNKSYDVICGGNIDHINSLLFHAYANSRFDKRKNKNVKFYLFEDGISTFSPIMEGYYFDCKKSFSVDRLSLIIRDLKCIYGNVSKVFVFNKDLLKIDYGAEIVEIPKLDVKDNQYKQIVNKIFDYENCVDSYDKPIIFMEESYYADGEDIEDVELVNILAEKFGKENIMVKIHPRNPVNRFKELGFATNTNTVVPWELILLNQNMSGKTLVTIGSSSVVNPMRIMNIDVKAYSLYGCLKKLPKLLDGPLWDTIKEMFEIYYPKIKICSDIDEVTLE